MPFVVDCENRSARRPPASNGSPLAADGLGDAVRGAGAESLRELGGLLACDSENENERTKKGAFWAHFAPAMRRTPLLALLSAAIESRVFTYGA